MKRKVLVTCPPMLKVMHELEQEFSNSNIEGVSTNVIQTLSEDELVELMPYYDGWIIGDDPATRRVLEAGKAGKLRAVVKWGVGVDNVDFSACKDLGIPATNIPNVFGREVADIVIAYVIGLARGTYWIDREIRQNYSWPKPQGQSTWNKTAGIVGFGDIGQQVAKRLTACEMAIKVYDPYVKERDSINVTHCEWPNGLHDIDFLIFTAPLNKETYHMLNRSILPKLKQGVRIVNVGRGPVIEETAIVSGLEAGIIHSVAFDVFENEPLAKDSPLRKFDRCIFGSHNGSNTIDAVMRVSKISIELMAQFLDEDNQ